MKLINHYNMNDIDDYDEIEVTTNGEDIVILDVLMAPDDDGKKSKVECHLSLDLAKGLREAIIRAIDTAQVYAAGRGEG